jgi:hypothetical protein
MTLTPEVVPDEVEWIMTVKPNTAPSNEVELLNRKATDCPG